MDFAMIFLYLSDKIYTIESCARKKGFICAVFIGYLKRFIGHVWLHLIYLKHTRIWSNQTWVCINERIFLSEISPVIA